ncbi:hypothetical protein BC943DRAFT_332535 [Umbelopsis sp. AD052]|nr:hypothetical protein BC943DRAFT_332535 [Umbelopsis sp. AD052]
MVMQIICCHFFKRRLLNTLCMPITLLCSCSLLTDSSSVRLYFPVNTISDSLKIGSTNGYKLKVDSNERMIRCALH